MEHLSEFNADRREFFRVNDHVFIEFTPLDKTDKTLPTVKTHLADELSDEKQRLNDIQGHLNRLIDQINQTDRDIARALRLMDEKLALFAQMLHKQQNKFDPRDAIEVNISGGGIAFFTAEHYPPHTPIEIQIEFKSTGAIIHAIARVVSCVKTYDAPKATPYLLRLAFTQMSETDRNLLVKQTLARQAYELRVSKHAST